MIPYRSTPVPNIVLDHYLRILKPTELTLLLVVIRQTLGWADPRTHQRKKLDWLTGSQLRQKTGYSRKAISIALDSLSNCGLIEVFDAVGRKLMTPDERKGKTRLYYAYHAPSCGLPGENNTTCVKSTLDVRTFYSQQKKLLQKKMTFN